MLTPEQLVILKSAILAETDPTFVGYRTNGQNTLMAAWFNGAAVPEVVVWRSTVGKDEITQNGFDWTRLDNLSVGKARVWDAMFDNASRSMNPSKPNVRAGIDSVWVGTASDLAVRAAVYVHCKRSATRGEKLYAAGSGTTLSPSTMSFEGGITDNDVQNALAS